MRKNNKLSCLTNPLKKPKSLNDIAYDHIKALIMDGKMVPGVVYTELELAKALGTSRTPVREALLRLAAENFITFYTRKGMSVKIFTRKDIEDLFELRRALEKTAYAKIAGRLTPEQIQEIKKIIQETESGEKPFTQGSREFHLYLIEAHGNWFITEIYRNNINFISLLIQKALKHEGRDKEALSEHKKILEYLIAGDVEEIDKTVDEHLRIAKKTAMENTVE